MPNFDAVERLEGSNKEEKGGLILMKKNKDDDKFKKPHSLYTGCQCFSIHEHC